MTARIGKHIARCEDNILFFYMFGDLEMEELLEYIKLAQQLIDIYGSFYIVDDLSNFGSASPGVRRMVASWLKTAPCQAVALYGGSVAARTLVSLILGGMRLMGTLQFPAALHKNELEARSWLRAFTDSRGPHPI